LAGQVATPANPLPPTEHGGHRAVEVPAAMTALGKPRTRPPLPPSRTGCTQPHRFTITPWPLIAAPRFKAVTSPTVRPAVGARHGQLHA
jgi:hypothetical protein